MSQGRIVVYTSIFGEYDGLLAQKKLQGVDYVCFTDHPRRASPWSVRIVEPKFSDPVRCAKEYKVLPHRFFHDYEYSVWIDGNYLAEGEIPTLIESVLRDDNMAMFNHNTTVDDTRNCLYEEYESIMQIGKVSGRFKDDPEIMREQIERYRAEGYPPNNGLISGGVLIRRHHSPDVIRCMEHWWREICAGSRRDQLSFNYVAWKEHFSFNFIEGNIRDNRWFFQIGIHRRDYRWKLIRYRLRKILGLR